MVTISKGVLPQKVIQLYEKIYYAGIDTTYCNFGQIYIESQLVQNRSIYEVNNQVAAGNVLIRELLNTYSSHILGASIIVGGVDTNGPQLYKITSRYTEQCYQYTAIGSFDHVVLFVFDNRWEQNMDESQVMEVINEAILSLNYPVDAVIDIKELIFGT